MSDIPSHPLVDARVSNRCVRVKKNGERCRSFATIGTTLCPAHGGTSPMIREAGMRRLYELQPLALDRVRDVVLPNDPRGVQQPDGSWVMKDPCPLCSRDTPPNPDLVAKVALAVLDRTGLGPQAKLEVEHHFDDAWLEYATEEEAASLATIRARCLDRMGAEPIDAEVRELEEGDVQEAVN